MQTFQPVPDHGADKNSYENETERRFHLSKGIDGVAVVGDRIGRLPFIEFVNAKPEEKILEAGCGGGWVARKLAKGGAKVVGCDKTLEMLDDAVKIEEDLKQGISYIQADITQLPFQVGSFDKVTNIATLFHLNPEECKKFFLEVVRVLRPGGEFYLSLNHFDLFQKGNPVREKETNWMTLGQKGEGGMESSQVFTEQYWNKDGNVFVVDIWYHPKAFLLELFTDVGLEMIQERSNYITDEVMQEFGRTGKGGYAAFWQAKLKKTVVK